MGINEMKERAYDIACKHGWYEQKRSNIHELMLVVSELGEAVNADRNGKYANRERFENVLKEYNVPFSYAFNQCIKDTVEDELADAAIRILSLAGLNSADLEEEPFSEEGLEMLVKAANNGLTISDNPENITFPEELSMVFSGIMQVLQEGASMGNVLVNIYVIAYRRGIDLKWHIEQKMKYNEERPYKHNKKY